MEISGEVFKRLCKDKPDETAKALLKNMREFGYSDLTLEEVKEAMVKALDGKADEVISIWVERYFETGVS
jgi:hypothetical protein